MRDPVVMRQAVTSANKEGTIDALRRSAWARIFPEGEVDIGTIDRALTNNRRSLSVLFGDEHLKNIKLIRDGLEIERRTPMPQGAPEQGQDLLSRIKEQAGTGVPQVSSRVFAAVSGRTSFRFIVTEMLGRLFMAQSKMAQERVLKEALVNPEIAREIQRVMSSSAQAVTHEGKPALRPVSRNLNIWLWNLGIPHVSDEEQP
jgi:hypothetical protein